MNSASFCDLFCEAFKCPPEDFNERVLWLCLFPKTNSFAHWLWQLNRDYFKPEFELIDQIKSLTSAQDIQAELDDFYYHNPPKGFFRKVLKVRISGDRLLELAEELFARANQTVEVNA